MSRCPDGAAGCSASLPQVSAGFRQRSAGLPQRSAISVGYSAELLVDRARWDPRLEPCLRAKMNENGNWGYDFRFHRTELKAPVRVTAASRTLLRLFRRVSAAFRRVSAGLSAAVRSFRRAAEQPCGPARLARARAVNARKVGVGWL